MASWAYILYTFKESSNGLKKIHAKTVEMFCQRDEALLFTILPIRVQKDTKNMAPGAHIRHISKSSFSELKRQV